MRRMAEEQCPRTTGPTHLSDSELGALAIDDDEAFCSLRESRKLMERVLAILLVVAAIVFCTVGCGGEAVGEPALPATLMGLKPRPVLRTTLENTGLWKLFGGAWRNLPFRIEPDEEKAVTDCARLAQLVFSTANGKSHFLGEDVRQELEGMLKDKPNFFYAEHLLGTWHRLHGDVAKSREYHRRAMEHAPAILIQRYEDKAGRPIANAELQFMEVECNRVQNGRLDPSLRLGFPALETDEDGCAVLPVYATVYRLCSAARPSDRPTDYQPLGWFKTDGRIGILPVAVVGDANEVKRK